MATLAFIDFEDALDAVDIAPSANAITNLVDQINAQFESGSLEVSPINWAHLASAVLLRSFVVKS